MFNEANWKLFNENRTQVLRNEQIEYERYQNENILSVIINRDKCNNAMATKTHKVCVSSIHLVKWSI